MHCRKESHTLAYGIRMRLHIPYSVGGIVSGKWYDFHVHIKAHETHLYRLIFGVSLAKEPRPGVDINFSNLLESLPILNGTYTSYYYNFSIFLISVAIKRLSLHYNGLSTYYSAYM